VSRAITDLCGRLGLLGRLGRGLRSRCGRRALVVAAVTPDACYDVSLARLQSMVVCWDLEHVSLRRWKSEQVTYSE
jgi:hypothetical protein